MTFSMWPNSPSSGQVGGADEKTPIDLEVHELTLQAPYNSATFRPTTSIAADEMYQPAALLLFTDNFADATFARFTEFTTSTLGVRSIAGNQFSIAMASGAVHSSYEQEGADITIPQIACSIQIANVTHSGADTGTAEHFTVGIAKDSNNFILTSWRRKGGGANGSLVLQVKIAGVSNDRLTVALGAALVPPFELGFSLVNNGIAMWRKPNGGNWLLVGTFLVSGDKNFQTTSLTGWKAVFSQFSDGAVQVTGVFANWKVGRFGTLGFRDPWVVTDPDGTPQVAADGTCTITATCTHGESGAAGGNNVAPYCGVFTLDLINQTLVQKGVIFVNRDAGQYNDNNCHIIDIGNGTYHVLMTTWGNFGLGAATIQVIYKLENAVNPTVAGTYFLGGFATLALPGLGTGGAYDPYMILTGGLYYIAYVVGPVAANSYYPALASSPDIINWTLIGTDNTDAVPSEGTRIIRLAGSYWVIASNATLNSRVYNLAMLQKGIFNNPFAVAVNAFPPHPMLIPFGQYVYQITFDTTTWRSNGGVAGAPRLFRASRYRIHGSGVET